MSPRSGGRAGGQRLGGLAAERAVVGTSRAMVERFGSVASAIGSGQDLVQSQGSWWCAGGCLAACLDLLFWDTSESGLRLGRRGRRFLERPRHHRALFGGRRHRGRRCSRPDDLSVDLQHPGRGLGHLQRRGQARRRRHGTVGEAHREHAPAERSGPWSRGVPACNPRGRRRLVL